MYIHIYICIGYIYIYTLIHIIHDMDNVYIYTSCKNINVVALIFGSCLGEDYVATDLRRLDAEPAELLAQRPMDDPLEYILYATSVGAP